MSDLGGSTVQSILENKDKIKQCEKISTLMRASKLNSRVLCVLLIVNLISIMKYAWQWGNYHWNVSWDNKLNLWTLILMSKLPSLSTVSVSTLFFWNQFRVLSEGCQLLVFGNIEKIFCAVGTEILSIFCPNGPPPSSLIPAYSPPHLHICKNYIHCVKQWR